MLTRTLELDGPVHSMEIPDEVLATVETWMDGPGRAALGKGERVARAS
ncbi:hypothetical protein ATI61_103400 [Archangium gephyra]|uniref:Uncharacterized protein n=1 Tax=Archangium gephyra TaxID=48 RepID=A0AAC8Q6X3_9BACT|nr:hypothetical protein [Archangium gephyra]AKJ01686.1 Hypothetical protein AA314_03312 [Archangium gephyra]REG34500.1 hypothetical protein ATI61_103400 [Archangium gephyra]